MCKIVFGLRFGYKENKIVNMLHTPLLRFSTAMIKSHLGSLDPPSLNTHKHQVISLSHYYCPMLILILKRYSQKH